MRIAVLLMVSAGLGVLGAQTQPNIKVVPVKSTSASSGQEMFTNYCASCHGPDGKGNGPVAPALKKAPSDLTTIAARNNGKFPELAVYHTIQGDNAIPAHGNLDMPVWGDVLKSLDANKDSMVRLRVANLLEYVKGLQKK